MSERPLEARRCLQVFEPVLQREGFRRRLTLAVGIAALGLACGAVWTSAWLARVLIPEPEAVRPPRIEPTADEHAIVQPPPWNTRSCGGGVRVEPAAYTPTPPAEALNATPTGRGSRRSGRVRVRHCFNADGKVERAEIVGRFRGDPAVDAVVLETVRQWWIDPDQLPVPTECGLVDFVIEFE